MNAGPFASSVIAVSFLVAAALFLSVIIFHYNAYGQNIIQHVNNASRSNSTLSVAENAQTMVKPDKVTLSLAVETTNTTAEEALNSNSEAVNNTLEALKVAGVLENETSTSFFNISPNYNMTKEEVFPPIGSRDIVSYTVTNSITIDSSNLMNVSEWIDTAVRAGVNDINSIYFTLSDEKSVAVKNDLLKLAVTNAKGKADIAASALGLIVIGVKSIDIGPSNGFPPLPPEPLMARESIAGAAPESGPPVPIIVGEQEVKSHVHVVFLLG